jgi:hypothetical protein
MHTDEVPLAALVQFEDRLAVRGGLLGAVELGHFD